MGSSVQHILNKGQKDRLRINAIQGSRFYKHYLLNKHFTIITDDYMHHYITFKKEDFYHFTGLKIRHLTPSNFFDICVAGTLTNSNIESIQHYDYNTLRVKGRILTKLNKFLHADVSTNLFLSNLMTNTYTFPCAIRNDKENMTICFIDNDHHARSIRKANNSHNTQNEKLIIGIFEMKKDKMDKCIYIRNKKEILNNLSLDLLTNNLKEYFKINLHEHN